MVLLERLIENGEVECLNCRGKVIIKDLRIICPICNREYDFKNNAADFYGNYSNKHSNNLEIDEKFVNNVGIALGFPNETDILEKLHSAILDINLVSNDSDHITSEIKELAGRLKIPSPNIKENSNCSGYNRSYTVNSDIKIKFEEYFIESELEEDRLIYRSFRVKNVGKSILTSDDKQPLLLSYHWYDHKGNLIEFEGIRSKIPKDIYPQQSVSIITQIKTPIATGEYLLKVCFLQESIQWFEHESLYLPIKIVSRSNHTLKSIPIFNQKFDFNNDQNSAKQFILEWIEKNNKDKKLRILEIGAGIFPQSISFTKYNCEVVCIDISFAMCQLGALYHQYVNREYDLESFSFICSNALNLPFKKGSFDCCIIFAALHHFSNPVELLSYLKNFVRDEGIFAIMREPCNPNPFDPDYLRDLRKGINEQMWSIEEYSQIFDRSGLRVYSGRVDSNCSLKVILKPESKKSFFLKSPKKFKTKKILLCSNVYPPNFIGGAELIAHQQAKQLQNLGYNVCVFTGDISEHGKRHSTRREDYDGLIVYRIRLTHEDFNNKFENFIHNEVDEYFKKILKKFSPDIVHFHNIIGLSIGLIHIAKQQGIKTVLTLHDHWGFCFKNTLIKNNNEICQNFSRCHECMPIIPGETNLNLPMRMRQDFFAFQFEEVDAFISPSQYLASAYIKAGIPPKKIHVIWNGIDVKRFSSIKKTPDPFGNIRFSFIGNFGRHKGIDVLLDALQYIDKKKKFIINLIGSGDLVEQYKNEVLKKGLSDRVKFWGRIRNIEEAYAKTDVFILPSIWPENQPVTITEAMAAGIPVIASHSGGIPELVVDKKTGFLFEPGNASDLANKMMDCMKDPGLIKQFGDVAYERIKENTLQNQIIKILDVYFHMSTTSNKNNSKRILIGCIGDCFIQEIWEGLKEFSTAPINERCRFVMYDWLQQDQQKNIDLCLVLDCSTPKMKLTNVLKHEIPLLVPSKNTELTKLCRMAQCGLYYSNKYEINACLEYLAYHDNQRQLMGKNGFKHFSRTLH